MRTEKKEKEKMQNWHFYPVDPVLTESDDPDSSTAPLSLSFVYIYVTSIYDDACN